MEGNERFGQRTDITIATIRSTSKRNSAMRILIHLNNSDDKLKAQTVTEISEALDMDWMTAKCNLVRLVECGFVELVQDDMDGRTKYFQIANHEAVEKAIELYKDRQWKLKKKEEELAKYPKPKVPVIEVEEVE